jgi:hypothetical protein
LIATFEFPAEPDAGIVYGGLFIQACQVDVDFFTDLYGDCRGFSDTAYPGDYRAYFRLNFRTGHGRVEVSPTCKEGECNSAKAIVKETTSTSSASRKG